MPQPRKFDWDAARRRYADGETVSAIAASYGVSYAAVDRVVNPETAERMRRNNLEYAERHRAPCVEGCGRLVSHTAARYNSGRCLPCATALRATAVRDGELRCPSCETWKPDEDFPMNRAGRKLHRGRHQVCRACLTIQRREYRNRNKVPCADGCGRMVLAPNEQAASAKQKGYVPSGCCRSCSNKRVQARARAERAAA